MRLFARALDGGARRLSMSSCSWTISGNCRNPYRTEVVGRPRDEDGKWHTFTGGRMTMRVEIFTRCRRCDNCANARRNEWRYRAREEIRRAGRTWFGTLTLSPIEQYRVLCEARRHAGDRALSWSHLTDDERFKLIAAHSGKEVTRYIKRVRKETKVPLRYICVTERHKSGLPHFHMLVHEVELKPVTHKTLSTQWTAGFEKWRLVPFDNLHSAGYVTKYLAKDAIGRVRASNGYGRTIGIVGPLLTAIKNT